MTILESAAIEVRLAASYLEQERRITEKEALLIVELTHKIERLLRGGK